MLDDYQKDQPIIYKILKNQIVNEKNSHAYLFETNGYFDSQKFIEAFIKSLLCPNKYLNKEKCKNCHQCEVIEAGNFPEIKTINPDGLWIKKEQLQELQSEFNEKAIIGTKRIYIWKNTLRIVPKNIIHGVGIDNFAKAFNGGPLIRKYSIYDKAHNEYLQILILKQKMI